MDDGNREPIEAAISRRRLLQTGAGIGAGIAAAGLVNSPLAHAAGRPSWPSQSLPAAAADEIVSSQFISTRQLAAWGEEVNRLGLRATGSPVHEAYVRKLAKRLRRAGLESVRREAVPLKLWLAESWSLRAGGQKFRSTYYMPSTKPTPSDGITAPTVFVGDGTNLPDVAGKIAVFDVSYTTVTLATFNAISYPGGGFKQPPGDPRGLDTVYKRPWFNTLTGVVDELIDAGAVAAVGIWTDLPGKWAKQYTPYDHVFRPIPGLWVDRDDGETLRDLAGNGATATVKLDAKVRRVETHNVVGFIPGKSRELTVLHTHTDGTNGMEENGQIPILAAAQYMARLPKRARDRTIMVFLSSGHFAGGAGIRGFLDAHAGDLVPRITSLLTLEHVGCTEWLPNEKGRIRPTGLGELGTYFAPSSKGLVGTLVDTIDREPTSGAVLRPFVASPPGSVEPVGWPGEGTYFWRLASLLDGNYITGPYGLITADLDITGMVDYRLMRNKAKSAVKTVLQLASASSADLESPAG